MLVGRYTPELQHLTHDPPPAHQRKGTKTSCPWFINPAAYVRSPYSLQLPDASEYEPRLGINDETASP